MAVESIPPLWRLVGEEKRSLWVSFLSLAAAEEWRDGVLLEELLEGRDGYIEGVVAVVMAEVVDLGLGR